MEEEHPSLKELQEQLRPENHPMAVVEEQEEDVGRGVITEDA